MSRPRARYFAGSVIFVSWTLCASATARRPAALMVSVRTPSVLRMSSMLVLLDGRGGGPEKSAVTSFLVLSDGNGGGVVLGRSEASFEGRGGGSESSCIPLS